MKLFLLYLTVILHVFIILKRYYYQLHMFQLHHYSIKRHYEWLYKNKFNKRIYLPIIFPTLSLILLFFFNITTSMLVTQLLLVLCILPATKKYPKKLPLKMTKRVMRITSINVAVSIGVFVTTYFVCKELFDLNEITYIYAIILNFCLYDVFIISHYLSLPIEKWIQRQFIKKAQNRILTDSKLEVIAITGSYGKTSTKNIVTEVLKNKYNVCVTPKSYNTPMGVTISVNNYLKNIDDKFVCEMGACNVGDIQELCDIVYPKIGILTEIGPQHLDTFINMQNIIKTKFELIEHLPSDGIGILNFDNKFINSYKIKNNVKVLTFGIENKDVMYRALNIKHGTFGSTFEVVYPDGKRYLFKTKLLGKHNISNILASIVLADYYQIDRRMVVNTIERLQPTSKRLELKNFPGYNMIDDSFNSNVIGFKNALEVLSQFKNKKIIITPGIIELGKNQYESNYEIGKLMANSCDFVVLIGEKQTQPIYDGLVNEMFDEKSILVKNSFKEGFSHVINQFKDFTLLIENDLPDNYNEE